VWRACQWGGWEGGVREYLEGPARSYRPAAQVHARSQRYRSRFDGPCSTVRGDLARARPPSRFAIDARRLFLLAGEDARTFSKGLILKKWHTLAARASFNHQGEGKGC
jgi:hypothetical protein